MSRLSQGREWWIVSLSVAVLACVALAADPPAAEPAGAATKGAEKATAAPAAYVEVDGPPTLYLTWAHDPCTTMVIAWLLLDSTPEADAPDHLSYAATGSNKWTTVKLDKDRFAQPRPPRGPTPTKKYNVFHVELKDLKPDTEYLFNPGKPIEGGAPHSLRFRTAPAVPAKPLVFASGGDAGATVNTARVFDQIAKADPLFTLCGGDVAYTDGYNPDAWFSFLNCYRGHVVGKDNRMIPLVCAIGNHETVGGFKKSRKDAEQFISLFPLLEDHSYAALDFGRYLSLLCLDSWHTEPIVGEQTRWLESALKKREGVPIRVAAYHVPGWPSYRPFDDGASPEVRAQWCPLFTKYHVSLVLEHHDHTYKRTIPLAGTQPAQDGEAGVTYIGDGGWGRSVRKPRVTDPTWYLAKSAAKFHYLQHTIDAGRYTVKVIDIDGKEIDRWSNQN